MKNLATSAVLFRVMLFWLIGCYGAGAWSAPQYLSSLIEPSEEIRGQQRAELNGDGLGDLLISVWSEERGRELLLYLQGRNGQFPGKPSQRIEIKSDIVAYGLAELRDDAGEELVFLTRNGVYSYSTRKEGYAGNLEKLFDWGLLATVPDRKSVDFMGRFRDLNGDGRVDILLPGPDRYAVFYGDDKSGFRAAAKLPEPYYDPQQRSRGNANFTFSNEDGLTLAVESPSPFEGLFPDREDQEQSEENPSFDRFAQTRPILDLEHYLASVHLAPLNGDNLPDFIYLDHPRSGGENEAPEQTRRVNVLFQTAEGAGASKPDWQAELSSSGQVRLEDFNADGLSDLLLLESKGSDQTTLRFFVNRGGKFNFQAADQVLRFSGYEVEAEFRDLNGNGFPDLIVSHYSLAAMDALRSGSVQRTTLIYASNAASEAGEKQAPIFSQRPNAKMEDKFSASNVKGLAERMHFSADVTGDGRVEALALDGEGALVARTIGSDLQLGTESVWRFVPLQLVQTVEPLNLNTDEATDFLLRHQNAVTVLVSQQ